MNLKRRELFRLGVLLFSPTQLFTLFGQGKPRERLHPPEPANQEFDELFLRLKSPNQPAMQLRGRGQEILQLPSATLRYHRATIRECRSNAGHRGVFSTGL